MQQTVTIYHNPECGTSRNTLALIRNTGEEPLIIEYLTNPPTTNQLKAMIQDAKLTVADAIRKNVEPYKKLNIENRQYSDAQLLQLMIEHPILINRPFVVTNMGTRLCRPSELVLDLLAKSQLGALAKEDGEAIIDAHGNRLK
jgi:arsenate reductase